VMIPIRSSSRLTQRCRSRTFFCSSAKNDSMAALPPLAPTRPIEPISPLLVTVPTTAVERNPLPLSDYTMARAGARKSIALHRTATVSDAVIRASME
jgi:hypothetical protein